jgi:SnoaL-like domain
MRIARCLRAAALGLLLFCGASGVPAEPPPATQANTAPNPQPGGQQVSESKGGYGTSLKQAFAEDVSREVVRGHFDQGSPPRTHRYYCLIDPKTGKTEPNGVAGQLVKRRDGMTGIKEPAVSPLSCADAEQKGLLVTSGYLVKGSIGSSTTSAVSSAATARGTTASLGGASASVSGSSAGPGSATVKGSDAGDQASSTAAVSSPPASAAARVPPPQEPTAGGSAAGEQTEILALYARFIFGQNAHDRDAVSELLLHSRDFVWAPYGGDPVWGYQQAMDTFEEAWRGTWRLDPQLKELRVASPAPGVAVLITPVLYISGAAGRAAATIRVRCTGVFVKTVSGWQIAAIFFAPLKDSRG